MIVPCSTGEYRDVGVIARVFDACRSPSHDRTCDTLCALLVPSFYGTSPTVVLDVGGNDVTFYGENNLDKLLYGCNKETIGPVPAPVEIKTEGLSFSGCYCCHTAPCDCSSFENANHYEVMVSVAPLPTVSSIQPASGPSSGVCCVLSVLGLYNCASRVRASRLRERKCDMSIHRQAFL